MLLKILLGIVVIFAALMVFAATRPDTLRIERSMVIYAPPERIFPIINDLHRWHEWAPQDREDPGIQRTFSGAPWGPGAISDWSGKGQTGAGRLTITESHPWSDITVQADWQKPFVTRNVNEFVLEPQGTATKVTWRMQGRNLYMMKVMSVFTNMDKMMGKHFEEGLANLKAAATSQ